MERRIEKGALVKSDLTNPILRELGSENIEIYEIKGNKAVFLTHRELVFLPLKSLELATLPYLPHYKDDLTLTVKSRLSNDKKVYTQAVRYGLKNKLCSSGSGVTCYLTKKPEEVKIVYKASWGQKTIKMSFQELEQVN